MYFSRGHTTNSTVLELWLYGEFKDQKISHSRIVHSEVVQRACIVHLRMCSCAHKHKCIK